MLFSFDEPQVPTVEADDVHHAIETNETCVILDVRTPGEYSRGKLPNSINLPLEKVQSQIKFILPETKQKIYVYCLSGSRSSVAVDIMKKLGYTNTYHMSHGLLAWRAKHFLVVSPS